MLSVPDLTQMKAIVLDCEGAEMTRAEQDLFRAHRPAGLILFRRNCVSKAQVRELIFAFREVCNNPQAPVLIDQEGGTIARLRAPEWVEYPSASYYAGLEPLEAIEATRLGALLLASDLADLGVSVNCAPVLDVPAPDCHEFLSASRTFGPDPERVADFGTAVCEGFFQAGVTPVIKHIPGHGRARVDSHFDLPVVETDYAALASCDFKPFKRLAQSEMHAGLWAMAAHVVYSAIDPDSAASVSESVVRNVIRGEIGFDGVLIADDVSMKALGGAIANRVTATMQAGMDLTMLCNASLAEREEALQACPKLSESAARRLATAEQQRTTKVMDFDRDAVMAQLDRLTRKRNRA